MSWALNITRVSHASVLNPDTAPAQGALWSILLAAATYTAPIRTCGEMSDSASTSSGTRAFPTWIRPSFTADHAWINHEWLFEVITASAFRLGGNLG